MPEISIIVPVYNAAQYIKRCYESVKNQTFEDYEIIFVDDESKDNSLEILKEIEKQDKKVKVITQKNKRQGGARNTGVRASLGNYISYIDIDDYVSPDFLEGLYEAIKEFDADISMTSVIRVKEGRNNKELLRYDEKQCYKETVQKARVTNGNGTGRGIWNKLFKKSFLIKNGLFFRENVSYEDSDYCAEATYLANKIATSNKGVYYYYVNKKSTMRSNIDKKKQIDKYTGAKLTVLFELKHGIINKEAIIPKFDYSLFGFNILRVKERISLTCTVEEYWLFDFIKIYKKNK